MVCEGQAEHADDDVMILTFFYFDLLDNYHYCYYFYLFFEGPISLLRRRGNDTILCTHAGQ